ncbi:MAG TPA: hypothetical protein VMQ65_09870 [Candidatus Limnocylindria bacterium]|nr:hypothetical protein [Candidatus Limnocylindria bacterium]
MASTSTTLLTFAIDLLDEGADVVARRAVDAGLTCLSTTAAYHAGRDLLPHNPVRSIAYQPSGAVYFQPDWGVYGDDILRPVVAPVVGSRDVMVELAEAATRHGLATSAWTVILHNSRLAEARQDLAPQTALGDRLLHMLCPANPAVQAYATALACDIAGRGPSIIHLESMTYLPFDHGGHHERVMIPLRAQERRMLGVCFCGACIEAAKAGGVDGDAVRRAVGRHLRCVLDGPGSAIGDADPSLERMLDDYLATRRAMISAFVEHVSGSVRSRAPNVEIAVIDVSGYFASLDPRTRSVDVAASDGFDLGRMAGPVDRVSVTAYFQDVERYRREVSDYVETLGDPSLLEVILRPGPPDSHSPEDLRLRVQIARDAGVRHLAFYNYGMMRLEALDWIRAAL